MDIIADGFINGTILNGEFKERTGGKSLNIDANYHKGHDNHGARTVIQINDAAEFGNQPRSQNRVYSPDGISPALMAQMSCGTHAILEDAQCVAMRGRMAESGNNEQQLEPSPDGKTNTLTSVQKDNLVMLADKSPCLHGFEHGSNGQFNKQLSKGGLIRRLTPTECERLQTVPDGYTNHVSDTQRYKMLGNGWTVDVIAHIFNYLKT
jgi:site-specific DNA-cytosine methylase